MPTFITVTLGCKVNLSESDAIASRLVSAGWRPAGKNETVDVYIVNTCAVTGKAAQQSRQAVRHGLRTHPSARMIVTGCYAQLEPNRFRKMPGVEAVFGHNEKLGIPQWILGAHPAGTVKDLPGFSDFLMPSSGRRTRPVLKIQDGCNAFCTYCIVPHARGQSRSMPPDRVLENLARCARAGYREVVLSGIHLGCYGMDLPPPDTRLIDLLNRIETHRSVERIRLSSIEPMELTEAIIERVAVSSRFCRHFHIPLQSGDENILQRMHRPYTAALFSDLVKKIHGRCPDAAIGADILIGFPGETEEAFANTYTLVESLPISYLHIFPFSPRQGTPASRYPNPVAPERIKTRCRRMHRLGSEKKQAFYRSHLDTVHQVVVEETRSPADGSLKGFTSNYIPVFFQGPDRLKNTLIPVTLERLIVPDAVWGTRLT